MFTMGLGRGATIGLLSLSVPNLFKHIEIRVYSFAHRVCGVRYPNC